MANNMSNTTTTTADDPLVCCSCIDAYINVVTDAATSLRTAFDAKMHSFWHPTPDPEDIEDFGRTEPPILSREWAWIAPLTIAAWRPAKR